MSNGTIFRTNGDFITAVLKACPSCDTISKFKFKFNNNHEAQPYGKKCIKCYSKTCNLIKKSQGYFLEYYQNNKDKISNDSKKYYHTHKMIPTHNTMG